MVKALTDDCTAITPSDDNDLAKPGIVFVGTAGDVKVKTLAGNDRTIKCPAGYEIKCIVTKVYATGTDADDLILYHD